VVEKEIALLSGDRGALVAEQRIMTVKSIRSWMDFSFDHLLTEVSNISQRGKNIQRLF
jgi:hypothetical protein